MKKWFGYKTFQESKHRMTSTEKLPLSMKSPLNKYGFSFDGTPFNSKMLSKS